MERVVLNTSPLVRKESAKLQQSLIGGQQWAVTVAERSREEILLAMGYEAMTGSIDESSPLRAFQLHLE